MARAWVKSFEVVEEQAEGETAEEAAEETPEETKPKKGKKVEKVVHTNFRLAWKDGIQRIIDSLIRTTKCVLPILFLRGIWQAAH